MYFGTKPYGLEDHIRYHGDCSNLYRGEDFAQPRTLTHGDVLSNGWQVAGKPLEGHNSSTQINFTNGFSRIIAPRLPLQLKSDKQGILPGQLRVGQILQTGCVVLDNPRPIGPVEWRNGQHEVEVNLTGGWEGHNVGVPYDIELAVLDEEYPPSTATPIGVFALERALGMREIARRNLPQLGQLALDLNK